jgi:glyoxylase-like metal-dependent hydrolase (beta-lactamase superfamily II)
MVEGIALPTMGYDDELDSHLGSRLVRVRWMPWHTGSDSVVTIPDARVVFTRDLFWHRGLPNLIDATTASWIELPRAVARDLCTMGSGTPTVSRIIAPACRRS